MKKIGIISDTHGYLDEAVMRHFDDRDEIWHAGDFGTSAVAETLMNVKLLRGVYGNVDGLDIRQQFPRVLTWTTEGVRVYMIHIGGYPPKYNPELRKELLAYQPQLFICGHSHILKIIYDEALQCLHINPGAAGKQGWHKVRTLVKLEIDGAMMKNCQVIELGSRNP